MVANKKEEFVVSEAGETEEIVTGATIDQSNLEGKIRISEDVIAQLATKALNSVEGVLRQIRVSWLTCVSEEKQSTVQVTIRQFAGNSCRYI